MLLENTPSKHLTLPKLKLALVAYLEEAAGGVPSERYS